MIETLKNKPLTVLIDGGSTHNFINQYVVNKFELSVWHNKKFQVMVANKERIECAGICQPVLTMHIHGCLITTDYYILNMAACLFVLRVQWLATLGLIQIDYFQFTMLLNKNKTQY